MARRRSASGGSGGGGGHDGGGGLRWLLTYADLITLLLAFFVIMYAMSSSDQRKFNALKSSLQLAFNGAGSNMVMTYDGKSLVDLPALNAAEAKQFEEIINNVKSNVSDQDSVRFIIDERGLTIRFMDSVLFDIGRASIRPDGYRLLDSVGASLRGNTHYIRVEGHADNLPINTMQFPSNWELSAARSIAVTRYLTDKHGLDPKHCSALGYGEHHPLYSNNSEENRAKNRRVDIVILRTDNSAGEIQQTKPIQ